MAATMADLGFNIDSSPMRRATRDMDNMGKQSKKTETSARMMSRAVMSSVAAWVSVGAAVAGVTAALRGVVRTTEEFARNQLRTEALLKATGNASGRTAKQLRANAEALALATLQSVEGVERAQQTLLTFRSVSGEVFDDTIRLATDLSTVMGSDLNSSVLQLAKALEDPTTGLTALRRSGVNFSQSQKDVIKSLVETGEKAEAQRIILAELEKQVGGVAGAEAGGLSGSLDTLGQRFQDLERNIGDLLDSNAKLQSFVDGFANFVEDLASGAKNANELLNTANSFDKALELTFELRKLESELADAQARGAKASYVEGLLFAIENTQGRLDKARAQMDKDIKSETEQRRKAAEAHQAALDGARAQEQNAQKEAHRAEMARLDERREKMQDIYLGLIDSLDPALAAQNEYFDTLEKIDSIDISGREKDRLREAAFEQHWKRMADIASDGAEDVVEEFENPWQSAADRVADGLQNAIASGDWDKLGDAIGNTLAASISSIVNKTITDALAQDLTANSGMFASIAGAFAGPIAGAVAGGVVQMAVAEVSDWLSGSDWDPTEARQASQGTGTVLGSIDAKSESIAKATDRAASASRELVGINRDMLRALQVLQLGIAGASSMVARRYGDIGFGASNQFGPGTQAAMGLGVANPLGLFGSAGLTAYTGAQLGSGLGGAAFGPLGSLAGGLFGLEKGVGLIEEGIGFLDNLTGGLFSDIGSSIFGGNSKVKDVGIQFFGATLDEMIRGWRDGDQYLTAQAYASIKKDGGWFSSDSRWDEYQRLGTDAESQISLVFMGIRDSVTAGAKAIGMSGNDIQSALDDFQVESQKISLEGLNAEQQAAELEAVFSSIFDQAAGAVVPYLDDFQMAGEGLGETLARVATDVAVTEQAIDMLGLQFSDLAGRELVEASQRLVEVNGGMEQFISGMQNFISNFATEAQQFEINANALASGMGNLPLPETREGFWQLLQAQDAATASGAENIATLLRLQGTANEYYSALEKAQQEAQQEAEKLQRDYYNGEIKGQRDRLNEAVKAQSAVESALGRMVLDSRSVQQASRTNALEALRRAASSGRVTASDELDRNLSAATAMQASDYATFGEYIQDYTRTTSTLLDLKEITDRQVTTEERMLSSLERQLEAVTGLRQDLERSQLAIIKQTNKSAKTLERIEIDGLEVRA